MNLFRYENRPQNEHTKRIYAYFELAHTMADFTAALFFLLGSIFFFWKALETAALWMFVVGSVLFMVKPTLKFMREIKMVRAGDLGDLEEREENEP